MYSNIISDLGALRYNDEIEVKCFDLTPLILPKEGMAYFHIAWRKISMKCTWSLEEKKRRALQYIREEIDVWFYYFKKTKQRFGKFPLS